MNLNPQRRVDDGLGANPTALARRGLAPSALVDNPADPDDLRTPALDQAAALYVALVGGRPARAELVDADPPEDEPDEDDYIEDRAR